MTNNEMFNECKDYENATVNNEPVFDDWDLWFLDSIKDSLETLTNNQVKQLKAAHREMNNFLDT